MGGGFQVQEQAIQTAIGHLTVLLNEAQTNDQSLQEVRYVKLPGGANETESFHTKLTGTSAPSLLTDHSGFIKSVQAQIGALQATLKRYQQGEDAAKYGFGN